MNITLFSQEKRFFQFVSDKSDESFISIEAGTFSGLSLISKRMQLSVGYSFIGVEGYSISSDLLLLNHHLGDFSINTGIGGGIIFKPEIDNFTSYLFLRLPIKLIYKNIFLSGVGMLGSSMFNYTIIFKGNYTVSIGYQFDLYRKD